MSQHVFVTLIIDSMGGKQDVIFTLPEYTKGPLIKTNGLTLIPNLYQQFIYIFMMIRAVAVLIKPKILTPLSMMRFGDKFKEKGSADEEMYFSKQEKKTLQNLLKKLEASPSLEDINEDKYECKQILNRYKVPENDALVAELLKWKQDK